MSHLASPLATTTEFLQKNNIFGELSSSTNELLFFVDMPELLYHLRHNYQFWKDMEERGQTTLDKLPTLGSKGNLPNIPENTSSSYSNSEH
ncbi:hypothetical protein LSTR_LSTR017315 [Laodelphax striatellus]|uniref:PDEase domain-containing protein n=1 Tax=Laodelphax striatellus TaxID=195883 RepID=A0A482XAR6_LAOST|nr:hypothetical protein LSTR_LSTR017315 [Laodelphax striatellus]